MFEVAAVFSDHCVLQREKNICVFGWSDEQGHVFAELFDKNGKSIGKNARIFSINILQFLRKSFIIQKETT